MGCVSWRNFSSPIAQSWLTCWNVQQTSVGSKADFPQRGKVVQPFADLEVEGIVKGGFGAQRTSFFVILLDATPFVIQMQGRGHAFGQDPRKKPPWCAFRDATLEDQLHVVGAPDVQVLANHFFKEDAPREGPVQHLGQRELCLQNGEFVAVAGGPVLGGEGMRQMGKPFSQQRVDLFGGQVVANRLQPLGIGAERMPLSSAS